MDASSLIACARLNRLFSGLAPLGEPEGIALSIPTHGVPPHQDGHRDVCRLFTALIAIVVALATAKPRSLIGRLGRWDSNDRISNDAVLPLNSLRRPTDGPNPPFR
jgi:hypothetical protein